MKQIHDWMHFTLTSATKQNKKVWLFLTLNQLNLEFLLNYVTAQAQEIRLQYPQKGNIYLDTDLKNGLFLPGWIRGNQMHFGQWKKNVQIANAIKKIDSDKVLFKIFTLDSVKDRNVLIQYKYWVNTNASVQFKCWADRKIRKKRGELVVQYLLCVLIFPFLWSWAFLKLHQSRLPPLLSFNGLIFGSFGFCLICIVTDCCWNIVMDVTLQICIFITITATHFGNKNHTVYIEKTNSISLLYYDAWNYKWYLL